MFLLRWVSYTAFWDYELIIFNIQQVLATVIQLCFFEFGRLSLLRWAGYIWLIIWLCSLTNWTFNKCSVEWQVVPEVEEPPRRCSMRTPSGWSDIGIPASPTSRTAWRWFAGWPDIVCFGTLTVAELVRYLNFKICSIINSVQLILRTLVYSTLLSQLELLLHSILKTYWKGKVQFIIYACNSVNFI